MSLRDKDPNVIAHVLMNPPKVVGYSVGSHDANNGEALKYLEVLQSMIQDEDLAKGIEQLKAVGDEGFGGVYATLLKHLRNKYSQNYLNLLKH
jgi:propanediol dehydratase large subunit